MRNVVITGVGIKSCIGNTYDEVLNSLKNGKSGITANETYKEMGFRSQISGSVDINFAELIDRKLYRFMGEASAYSYLAAKDAIEMSGITESHLDSIKTGIVAGSGGSSTRVMVSTSDITRDKGPARAQAPRRTGRWWWPASGTCACRARARRGSWCTRTPWPDPTPNTPPGTSRGGVQRTGVD